MKLQVPFVQLPLAFDAAALAAEVAAIDESHWRPHPQGFAGNSMLPLVAVEGDPGNEGFAGPMRPTPALQSCPRLSQAIASLQATVGRTRLMRLAGEAEVTRHADQGYYWVERVRVHLPIVTQPGVRFECGDAAVHMAAGECWIFDTWRQHRVLNEGDASRIHLVVDTTGGAGFWELVSRGRPVPGPAGSFEPSGVALEEGRVAAFACESVNVPAVMSPWELESHLRFLFEESVPHPSLAAAQRLAAQFLRHWRETWFECGDTVPEARARFRKLFDGFAAEAARAAGAVRLRNGMPLVEVVQVMLGRSVVAGPAVGEGTRVQEHRARGDNA